MKDRECIYIYDSTIDSLPNNSRGQAANVSVSQRGTILGGVESGFSSTNSVRGTLYRYRDQYINIEGKIEQGGEGERR